jgi:hypothetical protein
MSTRIVTLDIERQSAICSNIWQLKQNGYLRPSQIIVPVRTICFSWKWLGEDKIHFSSEWDPEDNGNYCTPRPYKDTGLLEVYPGHQRMIEIAGEVLDDADFVIGWNSKRYDVGNLRSHMAEYKIDPPSPHKDIDLINTSRSQFGFMSHTLEEAAPHFGFGGKMEHEGGLWDKLRWLPYTDPYGSELQRVRDVMKDYNKRDVELTEQIFGRMLPWIPKLNIYGDGDYDSGDIDAETRCRRCSSTDIQWRGTYRGTRCWYRKYFCNKCRGWGQGAKRYYTMETASV